MGGTNHDTGYSSAGEEWETKSVGLQEMWEHGLSCISKERVNEIFTFGQDIYCTY